MGLISSKNVRKVHNCNVLPANNEENDRSIQSHYLAREIWDKRDFSAPVESLLSEGRAHVLDIG